MKYQGLRFTITMTYPGPLADFLAAVGVLTCLPLSRPDPKSAACGRATLFFPLVGLCIGMPLAALHWLVAPGLPRWLAATLLVGVWEVFSGGLSIRPPSL